MGGLSCDGSKWLSCKEKFLLPEKPLSILFSAKFRDELKKTDFLLQVNPEVWKKDWVVDCLPMGSGEEASEYLAPYIFRVAITNNGIRKLEDGEVTFQYKESGTGELKSSTIKTEEFIRRFLQHGLPDGFIKARY